MAIRLARRGGGLSTREPQPSLSVTLRVGRGVVNAAVTYSKPGLATLGCYAKVELVPPPPAEIPTAIQSLKDTVYSAQTGSFRQRS